MPQKMSLRAKIASLWLVSIDHKGGGEFKRVGWLREGANIRGVICPG